MKILYAIQGTGNGHLARATELVPLLQKLGETHVLVSGIQGDLQLPFAIDYQLYGLSFIFGQRGGVDITQTLKKAKPWRFWKSISQLPVHEYDHVISDFEPISAWACKLRKKKCIGLSHQNAVLHPQTPKPRNQDALGKFILKHYAPSNPTFGFHFQSLGNSFFTPVIRSTIRQAAIQQLNHFTVYLPAYSDQAIINALSPFRQINWQVFSKHTKHAYREGNLWIRPVSLAHFTESFTTCKGILCTAGFETPAEALYMGKKLCVVPMKNQYEQACNAAFLKAMGVPVLAGLKNQHQVIQHWLEQDQPAPIHYPDQTFEILKKLLQSA